MALEKATVSINLGNGIDQKTDSKVGPDNKFNAMYDWIFNKLGKIIKRFGTSKLPDTVVTSFPNPLTIGASDIPSSTFAHNDQTNCLHKAPLEIELMKIQRPAGQRSFQRCQERSYMSA